MVLTREVSSVAVPVLGAERGCGRPSLLRLSDDRYDLVETVVGPPPRREGRHSMQAEQTESHGYLR